MRATNGFPEILPFPVTFKPIALIRLSRAISRYLSADVSLSVVFIPSTSTPSPSFCLLLLVPSYSGGFSASRLVCTHTLDCEFPRRGVGTCGKFPRRGNKWTWSRNWFSCLAAIGFSPALPDHPVVCRVCRDHRQSELDISCIDWGRFNLMDYQYSH